MATLTFTTQHPMQPWYKPNATFNREQTIVTSATVSATDVYLLHDLKVPHGAVITDLVIRGSCADGTYLFEFGMNGSNGVADVFGSQTVSATAASIDIQTTGLPYTVSVSDDATLRYQTFSIRVDGAATSATGSVSLNVHIFGYTR